jgi:hypothetical protein
MWGQPSRKLPQSPFFPPTVTFHPRGLNQLLNQTISHYRNLEKLGGGWSAGGKQLLLARGSVNSDVVLINNVK